MLNFSLLASKLLSALTSKKSCKTARNIKEYFIADVAASFQWTAFTHIAQKVEKALKQTGYTIGRGWRCSSQRLYRHFFSKKK
jgi:tRNA A37 threonylcarbamoyltransferase TsaD